MMMHRRRGGQQQQQQMSGGRYLEYFVLTTGMISQSLATSDLRPVHPPIAMVSCQVRIWVAFPYNSQGMLVETWSPGRRQQSEVVRRSICRLPSKHAVTKAKRSAWGQQIYSDILYSISYYNIRISVKNFCGLAVSFLWIHKLEEIGESFSNLGRIPDR